MKKLLLALAFVLSVFALSQYANANGRYGHGNGHKYGKKYYTYDRVRCESWNHNFNRCSSPYIRRIDRVRLVRQHSKAPCYYRQTWGADRWDIWVNGGCRATFEVSGWAR